jgi:hypothetical protein
MLVVLSFPTFGTPPYGTPQATNEPSAPSAPTGVTVATGGTRAPRTPSPRATPPRTEHADEHRALEAARVAERECREQMTNQAEACVVLRGAAVTNAGAILVPKRANRDFAARYPEGSGVFPRTMGRSRYHLKPVRINIADDDDAALTGVEGFEPGTVGFYQQPVSGAMYRNVWHTLSDMYFTFAHTLRPLLEAHISMTWVTESPRYVFNKGCASVKECQKLALFTAFDRLFEGRVYFARDGFADGATAASKTSRRFGLLLLGINQRCSPVPTEGLDVPVCQGALRFMRDRLLRDLELPVDAAITPGDVRCPLVHVMNRQPDKYRRITPFEAMVAELRASYTARGCPEERVAIYSLHGGMSLREQVATVANATILLAGRGGGTGYSPLLPLGAGYLSVSGNDRWSPYRGLVPQWITLRHYEARMVHHENPNKPPQKFYNPPIVDANRIGYRVDPSEVTKAVWALAAELQASTNAPSVSGV